MSTNIAVITSLVIALASALISVLAVYLPRKDDRDQQLLRQAILALERSYASLTNNGKQVSPPVADRLNWLTAARHIVGYKSLKECISTKLYRSLCEEHEEFWRHQFYLSLDTHKIHSPDYYDQGPPPDLRPPIEPRSAIIIYDFASWPKSKTDPIDSVNVQAIMKDSNFMAGNHGFREYLGKFPKITGKNSN